MKLGEVSIIEGWNAVGEGFLVKEGREVMRQAGCARSS